MQLSVKSVSAAVSGVFSTVHRYLVVTFFSLFLVSVQIVPFNNSE